jgi:hypothetical protein
MQFREMSKIKKKTVKYKVDLTKQITSNMFVQSQ